MAAFAFAAATSLALAGASASVSARTGGIVSLNLCTDELVLLVADPARGPSGPAGRVWPGG